MDFKKKIPAFTLMEVTIAMLISGIAIAITYTAYRIVSGTYLDYTRKQDRVAAYGVADKLLKKDFLTAQHITRTAGGLQLTSGSGVVSYEFAAAYLLRKQYTLPADTFKVPVKATGYTFENQQVGEGGTVDQLELQTILEGEGIQLIYKKTYSAQDLFN